MSVSLHKLIRASMGSFPPAFTTPSQNREYPDTFLHSAEVVTCAHKRSKPCCTSESRASSILPWYEAQSMIQANHCSSPPQPCGDPGLPPGIPVMHTIHVPRKTVVNPHNRVGITEYSIHYIMSSNSLTWPLGRIQMPRRASSLTVAADTRVASVARVMPLPYRRLTRRRILVCTGIVELLTIIIIVFTII
jgi:hypothetical protein